MTVGDSTREVSPSSHRFTPFTVSVATLTEVLVFGNSVLDAKSASRELNVQKEYTLCFCGVKRASSMRRV